MEALKLEVLKVPLGIIRLLEIVYQAFQYWFY